MYKTQDKNPISVLDTNENEEQESHTDERELWNQKVFQELTVTQKNLEKERLKEQIKINNLEIGNTHSQGFINYGINSQVYMNQHAFQQLMIEEKQSVLKKQKFISESARRNPQYKRYNEGTQTLNETT